MAEPDLDLDAIQARADAATPGDWIEDGHSIYVNHPTDPVVEFARNPDDVAFICHAREDVPALVAEVRRLREENAALRLDLDIERRTRQEHIERLGLTSMAATLNALSDAEDKILRLEAVLNPSPAGE